MVLRVFGALLRGISVALLIAMPALILPQVSPEQISSTMLIALCAAVFVVAEYAAASPALLDFRAAPPLNRLRFLTLALILLVVSAELSRPLSAPAGPLVALAEALIRAFDFPLSPLRATDYLRPLSGHPEDWAVLQRAAVLAQAAALGGVALVGGVLAMGRWSKRNAADPWRNLPTFASARALPEALDRAGVINIALGISLPFLVPVGLALGGAVFGPLGLGSPLVLIWAVAAWAFLPASLVMRGLAMLSLARQGLRAGQGRRAPQHTEVVF